MLALAELRTPLHVQAGSLPSHSPGWPVLPLMPRTPLYARLAGSLPPCIPGLAHFSYSVLLQFWYPGVLLFSGQLLTMREGLLCTKWGVGLGTLRQVPVLSPVILWISFGLGNSNWLWNICIHLPTVYFSFIIFLKDSTPMTACPPASVSWTLFSGGQVAFRLYLWNLSICFHGYGYWTQKL